MAAALVGVAALLALCQFTSAQFVSTPTNFTTAQGHANVTVRYKEVPAGICEQRESVKSYSGYADVSENEHIFWWFFEARNVDPTTAPLTVWINGGPGSSSMIGLFQELGPCGVDSDGNVFDNPYSWSNVSNMLFIDQPTQTGFSYSEPVPGYIDPQTGSIVVLPNNTCPDYAQDWDCGTYSLPDIALTANSTPNAAPNMYLTLQGFMGAFPQYTNGGFHFTTESYGGHYGPIFNQYFLDQNKLNASGTVPINLKAVMIGNGWFDPLISYAGYYNFTVSPGSTYNITYYNESWNALAYNNMYGSGNCLDQLKECASTGRDDVCSTADNYCLYDVENIYDIVTGRDEYDSRELQPDPFPPTFYVDYLNTPNVQAAIGAYINYSESNPTVGTAFTKTGDDARAFDIPAVIGNLVAENITTVLYFGDADYNCNWRGGLGLLPAITPAPPGFDSAGFANIVSNSSNSTHPRGQVRQSSNFAFVRIYQSGHEVPFYQPEVALAMFTRVLAGLDIATGNSSQVSVTTSGPMESTFIEGNATVQYDIVDPDSTYVWQTGMVEPPSNSSNSSSNHRRALGLPASVRERLASAQQQQDAKNKNKKKRGYDQVTGKRLSRKEIKTRRGLHHRAQGGLAGWV